MFRSALMRLDVGNIIVHYICLPCLEWLCIPDTVTGVLIELFLICNHTFFELMDPSGLSISLWVRFQLLVSAVGTFSTAHFASYGFEANRLSSSLGKSQLV